MLCKLCQNIHFVPLDALKVRFDRNNLPPTSAVKPTSDGPFYYPHYQSFHDLKASSDLGCHFCSQIFFAIRPEDIKSIETQPYSQFWLAYQLLQDGASPRAVKASCGNYHGYLNLFDTDKTAPPKVSDPSIDTNTGSDENLQLAKAWIDECLKSHKECFLDRELPLVLPTRVIDVSSSSPFLRVTDGLCGEYAILSHCWGKIPVLKTDRENIERWRDGIPISMLSKTFRDAVAVTKALGLQFLWIDSLCIIQDSNEDWDIESSKMGMYYANAKICVAAADAADGSVGCFMPRNPLTIQPCPIDLRLHGNKKISMVSKQVPDHWSNTGPPPLGQSPLDRRAWCLQEVIMCTRMLKFSRYQLEWACLNRYASESDPEGKIPSISTNEDFFRALLVLGLQTLLCGRLSKHNIWFDVLEQYTQRELTQSSDRLPALSGLATPVQEMTGDTYLAGIWKSDLVRSLLWRTPDLTHQSPKLWKTNFRKSKRPETYRAPSWSWASIDAASINWDHIREWASVDGQNVDADYAVADKHGESLFRLVSAETVLAGRNQFGQVNGGYLEVEGKLNIARVIPWEEGTGRQHYDDNLLDPEEEVLIGRLDADESDWKAESIYCLPLLKQSVNDEDSSHDDDSVLCLALVPVEGSRHWYTRVGVLSVNKWNWFSDCDVVQIRIL